MSSVRVDAGWEEVYEWKGLYSEKWHYFRKVCSSGKQDLLYTDSESKYDLIKKLWLHLGVSILLIISYEIMALKISLTRLKQATILTPNGIGLLLLCSFFLLVIFLMFYAWIGITMAKIKEKKRLKNHI